MGREIAPTNQWPEPHPQKVGGRATMFFPYEDPVSGVWGWTDRASEADGIILEIDDTLGIDDAVTTGGLRTFGLNGVGPFFAMSS